MALARWQRNIVDDAGNVQSGASVEVRSEVTGNLATIYSDRDGADQITNPITADANGFAAFHALGGAYRITATKGAFSVTWRYVGVGTGGEKDFGDIFTPRGPWDTGSPPTEYNQGDLVSHSVTGSGDYTFIANENGTTAEPQFTGSPPEPVSDENWTVLGVSVTGTKGDTGEQGIPGSSDVVGTSTTNLEISVGAKAFTIVEDDRGWGVGARLRASSDANPTTHYMEGVVTSYSGNTLNITIDLASDTGSPADSRDDWTINLAGEQGVQGETGETGNTGATGDTGPGWDQWQGAWQTATAYVENDAVENNGSSYICISDHTSGSDDDEPGVGANTDTYWDLVASAGEDGEAGGASIGLAAALALVLG